MEIGAIILILGVILYRNYDVISKFLFGNQKNLFRP